MTMLVEYCIGCHTYLNEKYGHIDCPYSNDNLDGRCPCTECIVKVMCGNPCEVYDKYVDSERED